MATRPPYETTHWGTQPPLLPGERRAAEALSESEQQVTKVPQAEADAVPGSGLYDLPGSTQPAGSFRGLGAGHPPPSDVSHTAGHNPDAPPQEALPAPTSSRWLPGLILGALLGAGGLLGFQSYKAQGAAAEQPCAGHCGEGTSCVDGYCRPEERRAQPKKSRHRGRSKAGRKRHRGKAKRQSKRARGVGGRGKTKQAGRGGRETKGKVAEDLGPALPTFVAVNDRHVPAFNPRATQQIHMGDGTGRISDFEIRKQLRQLEPAFNRCLETAAQYSEADLGKGSFEFDFGVDGNGRVTGINLRAPKHLRVFGTVPCMRSALFGHRFPRFNGPTMAVEYGFTVE